MPVTETNGAKKVVFNLLEYNRIGSQNVKLTASWQLTIKLPTGIWQSLDVYGLQVWCVNNLTQALPHFCRFRLAQTGTDGKHIQPEGLYACVYILIAM